MTEEYKAILFSRIKKLNFTSSIYLRRTALLFLLGAAAFLLFFFPQYLKGEPSEAERLTVAAHFCAFYEGLGFFGIVKETVAYSFCDMFFILLAALFGYTMLSGALCRLSFFLYCANLGYSIASLAILLIKEPLIHSGTGAFILFSASKFAILCVMIRAFLLSEEFSYSFSENFRIKHHPFFGKDSLRFLRDMASLGGCVAIINTVYLIFRSIQNFSVL